MGSKEDSLWELQLLFFLSQPQLQLLPTLIGGTSLFCRQEGGCTEGAQLPGGFQRTGERRVETHLDKVQGKGQAQQEEVFCDKQS